MPDPQKDLRVYNPDWQEEKFPPKHMTLRDYREESENIEKLLKLKEFIDKEILRRLGS